MVELGESLATLRNFLKTKSPVAPDDPAFQGLRRQVGKTLTKVVKNTKDRFADPWGLVAMDRAGNKQAYARTKLTNEFIGFDEKRPMSTAASA